MKGFLLFSSVLMLCSLSMADKLGELKDSKISRIQPVNMPTSSSVYFGNNIESRIDKMKKLHGINKIADDGIKKHLSNHELFESIGLSKLKISPSHHKKRLAVESRHNARPDDSKMFIIKLPPNQYYYINSKTEAKAIAAHEKNSIPIEDKNNKKLSVDFRSNGKPGRIYHWNIPVLKKIFGGGESRMVTSNKLRSSNDISDLIDIKHIPTWSKPWENETVEKTFGKHMNMDQDEEKYYKKKMPTYYAPVRPKKSSTHKYFVGDGKPKGFYVINKSNKEPHYQKLIP